MVAHVASNTAIHPVNTSILDALSQNMSLYKTKLVFIGLVSANTNDRISVSNMPALTVMRILRFFMPLDTPDVFPAILSSRHTDHIVTHSIVAMTRYIKITINSIMLDKVFVLFMDYCFLRISISSMAVSPFAMSDVLYVRVYSYRISAAPRRR